MNRTVQFVRQHHWVAALAAFAVFTMPAPHADAAQPERHAVKVAYGDLNLDSEAGARTMLNRLERAASNACGFEATARGFASSRQRKCADRAVARAVERLGVPAVSAIHASRGQTYLAAR